MNDEYQRIAANAIAHEAFCAGQAWQQAAAQRRLNATPVRAVDVEGTVMQQLWREPC